MSESKPFKIKAWGGFCDDELRHEDLCIGANIPIKRLLAVYKTRAEAREVYQDVRRIEIREVKHK